ncbi:MAG: tagaturonate reductase [Muribaculaceae bacterium]|nr:tagaturonate reductase [Muribaculaceae bacterium]
MKTLNNSEVKRTERPVRILQFGEGNFLRAFADWMIDIANEQGVIDTSITVVSPRFKFNNTIQNLTNQDALYHVYLEGVEKGKPKKEKRLVKSIKHAFSPVENEKLYKEIIESPELRFVISNTTEQGIKYDEDDATKLFAATFPGKLTALLHHRYLHFKGDRSKGLMFICCELSENNGARLHDYILRHAENAGMEKDFSDWVNESCVFCDTLVDRIVSGYPAETASEIEKELGFEDKALVKGELYHLWVVGGEGAEKVKEELPLHKAGLNVYFLPSVKEFRDKKVRILNGAHTGMVALSLLSGHNTVFEAFTDPEINKFVNALIDNEVIPVIPEDQKELKEFAAEILERFLNPYINHQLKSIALNSLSKWETRNFPTVKDNWTKLNKLADLSIFTFAALLALYAPDSGFTPEDNPEHVKIIQENWDDKDLKGTITKILESGIFNENFEKVVPGFTDKAAGYLASIRKEGIKKALSDLLK